MKSTTTETGTTITIGLIGGVLGYFVGKSKQSNLVNELRATNTNLRVQMNLV